MVYTHNNGVVFKDRSKTKTIILTLIFALMASIGMFLSAYADSVGSYDFEDPPYTTGDINGQEGWTKTGPYDHEVASQATYSEFGDQSLRISNAVTSGSFGDHTISPSLSEAAGESGADNVNQFTLEDMSSEPMSNYFEASWDFASVTQEPQPGLFLNISPDRGDGARMSYVGLSDDGNSMDVIFYDYQAGPGGPLACDGSFVMTTVATGLDRTEVHTVKIQMYFVDGPSNDTVTVTVNESETHTGTSWEDYFRGCEGHDTRTVDSLIFLTRGTPAPGTSGSGFYIDNVSISSNQPIVAPTSKDDCKNDGWEAYGFRNQGQCIRFVNTGQDSR